MKIQTALLVLVPSLLLSGCNTMLPHSSNENVSLIARHPERHLGELVSTFGEVLKVDSENGTTVFQITTPNFVFSFLVSYPGEIPGLMEGQSAYFLGRVTGAKQFQSDAYTGITTLVRAVTVDGIAIQPVGGTKSRPFSSPTAIYRPEEQALAQQWLRGDLDLTEPGYRRPPPPAPVAVAPTAAAAPASVAGPAEPSASAASAPAVASAPAAPPTAAAAPSPRGEAAPSASKSDSRALKKLLKEWKKLSPEDQAKFLERVGQGTVAHPAP